MIDFYVLIAIFTRTLIVIITLIVCFKLFLMYQQYKFEVIKLPFWGFMATASLMAFQVVLLILFRDDVIIYLPLIDGIFGLVFSYFLILFVQYYESLTPNSTKVAVFSILGTLCVIAISFPTFFPEIEFANYMSSSFILFFIYFVKEFIQSMNKIAQYENVKQKQFRAYLTKFVLVTFGGISSTYFILSLLNISNKVEFVDVSFLIAIAVLVPLFYLYGIQYFYRGYIQPQDPTIMQAQKLDKLIIMSKEGIPVFEYEFLKTVQSIDSTLLSGALTAITAILKEATQISGELESIKIGDRYVMIAVGENLSLALFTYKPTSYLTKAIEKLMTEVERIIGGNSGVMSDGDTEKIKEKMIAVLGE